MIRRETWPKPIKQFNLQAFIVGELNEKMSEVIPGCEARTVVSGILVGV